jgi:rhodanese-related sulfurtransferase
MNLRRHLLETVTILLVAVAVALVSNTLASRERKLKLPGDYPNATTVTTAAPAGDPFAPEQAASPMSSPSAGQDVSLGSSPATAQQTATDLSSKVKGEMAAAPAVPQGTGATTAGPSPSKKIPVSSSSSPAAPAADRNLLARFPPHPDKPWVEISGEDAARLHAAGVPFLDARRTSLFEEGHVAGARPVSVWESDVDEKVMELIGEQDGAKPLVIYCSGGDCEDSHLLAQKLWGAGFNDLLVYRDGFPDWVKRGGAVHHGATP